MNITYRALKSPSSVFISLILILLLGVMSIYKLPIQLTPDIQQPQISIYSGWRQAAPEEVESVIIEPIENAVKNTPGALRVETQISSGQGTITLTFAVGTDMQEAMLNVLTSLNQTPPLPLDAIDPVVTAGGGSRGGNSVATLLVTKTDTEDIDLSFDMSRYQKVMDEVVEPRLAQIKGVASVNLDSERSRELRIEFNPYKAAAYGVNISDLRQTLNAAQDTSAGLSSVGRRQYTVRFTGQYSLDDLLNMRVAYSDQRPIYLRDIASARETFSDRTSMVGRNGKPAYYIRLVKSNDANTVEVLDELNIAIKELNQGPLKLASLQMELSFDASVHIRNALALVRDNLGLGVLLSCLILSLFFRDVKRTFFVACTIPVSLLVALIALNIFERSINVVSLAGLAFAVGLVIDAAIIVQENISSQKTNSLDRFKTALLGTRQVSAALLASTATTVAIFLPIVFLEGVEGQLFSDLALTLSIAVVSSLLCALTLIPLLNYMFPKHSTKDDPYIHYWHRLSKFVMQLSNSRAKQFSWIAGLLGGAFFIIMTLMPKTDFMPRAPTDGFFFSLVSPPGANIEYLEDEVMQRIKDRLMPYYLGEREPAIKDFNFYVFGTVAGGFIYSADPMRVDELIDITRNEVFLDLPDTQAFVSRASMIQVNSGGDGRNINVDFVGPDLNDLILGAQKTLDLLKESFPEASARAQPSLDIAEPELRLTPNDRRITQAGLNRQDVSVAVQAFTGGLFVNEYFNGNERLNVILRSTPWESVEALSNLPIYTPNSGIQTLGELSHIERTVGPSQLRRVNGNRTVSIIITPPDDMSLEQAQSILQSAILPSIRSEVAESVSVLLSGNTQDLNLAIHQMGINFALAMMILFLLLVGLFKSVIDSLLVLLIMPLALAGGVLALFFLNLFSFQSLDLLTMIGFIILLGLVVNNAILLVDQTRKGESTGLSRQVAVMQAVQQRARPIYLSTLTSLVGMLPLMLVPGAGSEIYRGLASVIVGGMAVCAIFTLILMPCLLQLGTQKNVAAVGRNA
ncbi:efflux RND transporter permease subunit [Glaciecola siphonariae]|uniref:Efflux RND transporter permease subunit n=1 Tax=Glaciecola siphonariae TaxID=521012 RepID=A0ABV9LR65_9ALTE